MVAHNKTSDKKFDFVKAHINSFPRVESHFCRRVTSKEFLEAGLNIAEMYRLYLKFAEEKGERDVVTEPIYRKIFKTEFNLSFHARKKDQCDTCAIYQLKTTAGTTTEEENVAQEEHLSRKQQARDHKDEDKKQSDSTISAVFDLQQVMTCPKLNVGVAYYLRKLNICNLTIYELQPQKGICNVWTEAEHNQGTNEVTSCLIKWLTAKDELGFKHAVLYSDTCGGQNRKKIMCTALMWFLLKKAKNIVSIEQKFFESDHGQNDCDSLHSCIQQEFTSKDIHLPTGYYECMKSAIKNKKHKYVVYQMQDCMYNFDELNRKIFKTSAFSGIQLVHHIVYQKENGGEILFSQALGGELQKRDFTQRKCLKATTVSSVNPVDKIDAAKKKVLCKLAQYLLFDCRAFYLSL